MGMQAIEYQGNNIQLHEDGRYVYNNGQSQCALVIRGKRQIYVYGANVIEQTKALLDKASFNRWFAHAKRGKGWPNLGSNVACYRFPA